jgi:hypothetical protein
MFLEKLKDIAILTKCIDEMEIDFANMNEDGKISKNMVKCLLKDIVYLIASDTLVVTKNIDKKAMLDAIVMCRTYLLQKTDLWHSVFITYKYKQKNIIPDIYKENHHRLYHMLGGQGRDFNLMEQLFKIAEYNCEKIKF